MRQKRIALIQQIAGIPKAFDTLEEQLANLSREMLSEELLECGIIPERFAHDSSEEKLWAKYCDILLSKALSYLGLRAQVIRARGDSADVLGEANTYSIVGDAKAFRLSRTAKNQKDFKVSALDDWRRSNTFACLLSPLYQYPSRTSQIYKQAEEKNVTLLSYIHLKFLLDYPPEKTLEPLWQVARNLEPSKNARIYWESIDDTVIVLTNQSYERLRAYKQHASDHVGRLGSEGIDYWRSVIDGYHALSKKEAVAKLIAAEKIDQKIETINKTVLRAGRSDE